MLPSQWLQVPMEPRHVCFELGLGDGEPLGIPAVPSHWGRAGQLMLIQRHGHGAEREDSRQENERAAIHEEVLLNSLLKNLVLSSP